MSEQLGSHDSEFEAIAVNYLRRGSVVVGVKDERRM
jgi:hypothetical protein